MIEWKKWNSKVVPMIKTGFFIVVSSQNEDVEICKLWLHDGEWKWVNQNDVVRYALESDQYTQINLPEVIQ